MQKHTAQVLAPRRRRLAKRDAVATREKILQAAIVEFCARSFSGARPADIARRAGCNIRMIYHYFGSKERIYLAALERVYGQIRAEEEKLDLLHIDPVAGISKLVEFTFDHMASHMEFVQLVVIENIQRGKFLKRSSAVPQSTLPLIHAITDLLLRGQEKGIFRKNVDPVQLYVSILSLSLIHLSNRYTLSITYRQDLGAPEWLKKRRAHVREMVLGFLRCPSLPDKRQPN